MWPRRTMSLNSSELLTRKVVWVGFVALVALLLPHSAPANRSLTGEWKPDILDLQSRAVHMTLLKGVDGNHSRIVWWPEDNNDTSSRIWDWNPMSALPDSFGTADINSNLFCAGHSVLATGDILATGGTDPVFRRNMFTGNYNGAVSQFGALPNFGNTEWGDNSFIGNVSRCLWNRTTSVILSAKKNFWNSPCDDPPQGVACVVGADVFPCLVNSPLGFNRPGVQAEPIEEPVPTLTCLTGSVIRSRAEFEVRSIIGIVWTEIRIFDVLGRLSATIPLNSRPGGVERVDWIPNDGPGGKLSSGFYFATAYGNRERSPVIRLVLIKEGESR